MKTLSPAVYLPLLRAALREDEEDLAAFAERSEETPLSYEQFLTQLKADGTL